MSANKTANYHLNQWEPEDKVLREEFNADNLAIENALTALAAADAAESAARQSLSSSIGRKGNCSVGTFAYTGTGTSTTTISFPRVPLAFIVNGYVGTLFGWGSRNVAYLASGSRGTVSWSGATFQFTTTYSPEAQLNAKNETYYVTAFYSEG